jgi:hypothetical protein
MYDVMANQEDQAPVTELSTEEIMDSMFFVRSFYQARLDTYEDMNDEQLGVIEQKKPFGSLKENVKEQKAVKEQKPTKEQKEAKGQKLTPIKERKSTKEHKEVKGQQYTTPIKSEMKVVPKLEKHILKPKERSKDICITFALLQLTL